jgi:hypothetical protein
MFAMNFWIIFLTPDESYYRWKRYNVFLNFYFIEHQSQDKAVPRGKVRHLNSTLSN